jgi:hypothetical protein
LTVIWSKPEIGAIRGCAMCRLYTSLWTSIKRQRWAAGWRKFYWQAIVGPADVAPPGIPVDRVRMLRDAYTRALKDSDLIAEVNKSRLDMEPSTGEEIQEIFKSLKTQPREVIELVKKLEEN